MGTRVLQGQPSGTGELSPASVAALLYWSRGVRDPGPSVLAVPAPGLAHSRYSRNICNFVEFAARPSVTYCFRTPLNYSVGLRARIKLPKMPESLGESSSPSNEPWILIIPRAPPGHSPSASCTCPEPGLERLCLFLVYEIHLFPISSFLPSFLRGSEPKYVLCFTN